MPIRHYNLGAITLEIDGVEIQGFGSDEFDGSISVDVETLPIYRPELPAMTVPIVIGERSRRQQMRRAAYLYRRGLLPPLKGPLVWEDAAPFWESVAKRAHRTAQALYLDTAAWFEAGSPDGHAVEIYGDTSDIALTPGMLYAAGFVCGCPWGGSPDTHLCRQCGLPGLCQACDAAPSTHIYLLALDDNYYLPYCEGCRK